MYLEWLHARTCVGPNLTWVCKLPLKLSLLKVASKFTGDKLIGKQNLHG